MRKKTGFTLIELIFVVTIMGIAYVFAWPQLSVTSGLEAANKMSQLGTDIRSAFDLAVLSGRIHRITFHLATGDYWLEMARGKEPVYHDQEEKLKRELTKEELEALDEEFEAKFKVYEDKVEEVFEDTENEKKIDFASPVLKAKKKLMRRKWYAVENAEWSRRSIGPNLLFQDIQTERHGEKLTLEELEDKGIAYLYFSPAGYVEEAVLHVAYNDGNFQPDPDEEPYTVSTNPSEGTASIVSGYEEKLVGDDE